MNLYEMFDSSATFKDALSDFLPMCINHLGLKQLPKITFQKDINTVHVASFGTYDADTDTITLVLHNRQPVDILRTLAHELVHAQQRQNDAIKPGDWRTGSPIEDDANAGAGVIMRMFAKQYPKYLTLPAVEVPGQLEEKRKRKSKRRAYSGGYYGYYYGGTNTDSDGGGDGGGESMYEGLGKTALVGVLAAALSMAPTPAQAEPSAAGQALTIYRKLNALKGYGQEGLTAEGEQELRNILHSIQGHPNQSRILPIIKDIIKTPEEETLPPMTMDEDANSQENKNPGQPIPFPPGTTLVDVSDVYDWYKLGMAVSDLDDADPRVFNKGVPHTVFAFGSEEEEHKMIPLLKNLGFSLHDIDNPRDYEKAIRADEAIKFLEEYSA